MKLITQKIIKDFLSQGDTSNKLAEDIKIVCKFFHPTLNYEWYLFEKISDDEFMAFVNMNDPRNAEIGYVSLSEIIGINYYGLKVERDLYYTPEILQDRINKTKRI